jgi:hypothetical protein
MENGGLQDMKLIIVSAMTRTKLVALVAAAICQLWMEAHPPEGGFRLSWGIAMWARLERGDKVGSLMETYMKQEPAANLHNTRYNQSDGELWFYCRRRGNLASKPRRGNLPVARLAAAMAQWFSPGFARARQL